ncbi:thiamine pyrophosphate-dependent dehydrogenase E1 component subunit alpha [Aestuariivirga sp. YIM B02566]|uniref:Thiamine pyrophosphate-dependent dehydrogenase E1 component subunit alpha n=1 Tax=Taklimakanibacter albus TaxID=2800327 RepID=A0ACC5R0I0_9HYPH|nr:thiamine pyrophosphate-dependent dehydrogenase E1 component subunit alpha [Aestuariivirga sp. YIM B02566]MBK1866095.1 thiamine pyrophosphate-dependent dehydrogenase E1 component subunit alpha [Aestuariivirga sp. YIM B02566]
MKLNEINLFRTMVRLRAFDEACIEGVPTFEIHGELHTSIGQEAIGAAMAQSLTLHDAVVSTHRNHYHALAKGVPPRALMAEIFEKETGLCRGRGGHMHPFDPEHNFSATGIVGASLPVALGYAYNFKLKGLPYIAVGICGDGATNHGTFHECLNMAAAWGLPLVCLVENNQYAISVRFSDVTATPGIAERAAAYGAFGRRVDGTDVEEVVKAFAEVARYTRKGGGPSLLEATCYRHRGHYEGDHDNYRERAEKQRMRAEMDPIARYRRMLVERGAAEDELDQIVAAAKGEMSAMLADIRKDAMPDPAGAMDHVFAEVV